MKFPKIFPLLLQKVGILDLTGFVKFTTKNLQN